MVTILGHEVYGSGRQRVVMMHDWFGDRTNWDAMRPYLAIRDVTYAFVDSRGYGESRRIGGSYTLEEASQDVLTVADILGWPNFAVVGHSMSTLIAQGLLQIAPTRITAAVLVAPVPPTSLGIDGEAVKMSKQLALSSHAERIQVLRKFWGPRLSDAWIEFKARRWGETADRNAAAAYVDLYGGTDISKGAKGIKTPMLIISGEQDAPPFRSATLAKTLLPYYPNAKILSLAEAGHYPMQEMPPYCATLIDRFLSETFDRAMT